MGEAGSTFACPACGKQYRLKPEWAGRKLKCQCGNIMTAPAAPPQEEELYDVVPDPTPRPAPRPAAVARPEPVSPPPAQSVGVLPYRRPMSETVQEGSPTVTSPFRDLILPGILIVVGAALRFVDVLCTEKGATLASAVPQVTLTAAVDLVLTLAALLACIRLLDIGLGPIGTAILKVCAVALGPAAVASLVGYSLGRGSGFVAMFVALILYIALFKLFFDMDLQESMICVAIIWVINTWVGVLLVGLMMG